MSSIPNEEYNTRVSNSTEFEIGDMVWGKVKSHPWWPGYILDESIALPSVFENKVDGFILVAFFGDGSYGWLDSSDIIPYAPNFLEKSKQSTMKSFVKAVDESVDEFNRRAALGISCRCRNGDNFRIWNVEDYFLVDVAGYEPNGVYDRRQIEIARSDFKSKNTIDFLKNLAMNTGEVVNNDMDMDSVRDLARLNAVRRSFYLENDPTLDEAFGVVGGKQAVEKDETSAKKDEAKKSIESWKKSDHFLKRSSQQHSTLKLKGTSSTSLPKASSSVLKKPKLLEDSPNTVPKHRTADESNNFEKATNTNNKHKFENADDQLDQARRKTKKHKVEEDLVLRKLKKHKKQSTLSTPYPCLDLPSSLPHLLSLAKDQSYGEEQNISTAVHDLFLKFRKETYLKIFDKVAAYQESKAKPVSGKPHDDSKSSDNKVIAYNQEAKATATKSKKPDDSDKAIPYHQESIATAFSQKQPDDSKTSDKAVAYNQESKTTVISKKPDDSKRSDKAVVYNQESKTTVVPKKPEDSKRLEKAVAYNQESKTTAVSKKPDDSKTSDKAVAYNQEPNTTAILKKKPDDLKRSEKAVAYNEEAKARPTTAARTKLSKPNATTQTKSSKPTATTSKKPEAVAYNEELKTPTKTSSNKHDEPKSLDKGSQEAKKAVAYNEEASEEAKLQKAEKPMDTAKVGTKRALPDRLIETSIKKAKLARLKALREKTEKPPEPAGGVPAKEESQTYLFLKFPRKSPLPSVSNLKVRFAQFKNMVVEGNKVMWNQHACRVQFRYRSEAVEAMKYAKSNYLFGQFEIECSLRAVEGMKEKEAVASGPKSILKKAGGGNGSDSGKDNQRVLFMLPSDDASSFDDVAMMRDAESGSAAFRMQSSVLSEERKEPPPAVQGSREWREAAVQVSEEGGGSGEDEDEEYKRTFLELLRKCADIVDHMRSTPGFSLHRFL